VTDEGLSEAVGTVIRECLGVGAGEEVLVVCNPATQELGAMFRDCAQDAGGEAALVVIAERESHAAEPPPTLAAAMLEADVLLAPTMQSLSHTAARKAASEAGARVASMPGVTAEMLARVMGADMEKLRERGELVSRALSEGSEARITSAHGSDLRLGLEGRTAIPDAGVLRERGAFGNLPCGEGFIAPLEGTAEGTLVIDGSIAGVGKVEAPVSLTIRDGHLAEATNAEGVQLLELLGAHGPDGTNVAELGIGTNEAATLTGNVLEDEKILGTAHLAFGASAAIGGTVQVPVHLDCVVLEPTIEIDGEPLVRAGELLA
jgi:leucyl aminopeptidase (aminopeptidase T)